MLWVSWPKKTSGVQTDLTENIVRDIGLAAGLVDVKVCAIDDVWSGLKFVYRVKDRPASFTFRARPPAGGRARNVNEERRETHTSKLLQIQRLRQIIKRPQPK